MRVSLRLQSVQSPVIPIVGRWVRETPGTISLGQGMVSYRPPEQALEAARRFASTGEAHEYGPVEGDAALVQALHQKLSRENRIEVEPDSRVVVTAGGNMAFVNALLAVADPGDEVVLVAPYYFNHEMAVVMASCRPVVVPAADDHQLDVGAIRRAITPRTRAVVTVSPNNPTGAVYSESDLRAVSAACAESGIYHVHDEAYEYFTYEDAAHFSPGSIAGAGRHTISLFSLSKAYGLAGWRIGYMVIPTALWDAVNKIQDTILICPPRISQAAATAALGAGRAWCRPHVDQLAETRRVVLAELAPLGDLCQVPSAKGALYVLLRVPEGGDALRLTERLVREHRVAVIPGTAFGIEAPCALRVSYGALQPDGVREGIGRLVGGLRALVRA
jgi:aspartate/methionine/tyrosine aminotransferase